jgi:RNA polymerase sigma-70 factor (ECF subfamily)
LDINDPYEESELISLLKQKDIKAYHYFYDKYAAALYGFILRVIKNEESANEVLHEIFTTLWSKINSYEPQKERLFSWLLKITRNASIYQRQSNYFEEAKHSVVNYAAFDHELNPYPDLNEESKRLIDLSFYHGHTQDEIAAKLNIPVESVKAKLRIALLDLRKTMK